MIPDSVDLRDAAAFSVAHTTAMHTLRTIADLQPGETVLVLGAAGGVGLASVELATLMGGQVIAAASSPEKLALCAKYGAVAGIDYTKEDLKVRAKELTGGGAGVVVDPVGGPYSEQALRATKWGSRFVVVGFAAGEIPRIPLNLILLKGVIVRGMEMRSIVEAVPDLVARDQRELQGAVRGREDPPPRLRGLPARRHRRRPPLHARAHRHRQGPHRRHPVAEHRVKVADYFRNC